VDSFRLLLHIIRSSMLPLITIPCPLPIIACMVLQTPYYIVMKNPHAHHFTEHDTIAIARRSLMLKILCIVGLDSPVGGRGGL